MSTFRKRSINAIIWSLIEKFGSQFLNLFISIFLARILEPQDFGLIGMIMVVITLGNSLRDSGLTQSLIRGNNLKNIDYSSVFVLNVVSSLFIYFAIYLLSPLIAAFYEEESLTQILRILALIIPISAISSIQETKLVKELKFKTQLIIQVPSLLISGGFGIYLAYNGYGVWSLVYMHVLKWLILTIQFWLYSNWVPSIRVDFKVLKYHFNFGYKLALSTILDVLFSNLYNIIIGKNYSAMELGFYTRADSTKQIPVNNISFALKKATYPIFAEISDDNDRLKAAFKGVMLQSLYWITPILIGLAILAEPIFIIVFTEKWLPAVPMFQILCFVGVLQPAHTYNLNILKVKGRSDVFLKVEIIKKVLMGTTIFFIIPFGIYGLLYYQVAYSIVCYFINGFFSGSMINYPIKEQLKDILPIFVISTIMASILIFTNDYFGKLEMGDINRIIFIFVIGFSIYVSLSIVFKVKSFYDFLMILRKAK